MSATTSPTTSSTRMHGATRLSFPHLVRSEWIKLRSIRSTFWCYAILVLVTIGMAALVGANTNSGGDQMPTDIANGTLVNVNTVGVLLSSLVVGVLGVLIITGEYGTGQVRSTFTADPRRTGVILAKAVVLAVTTFVVSAVATWIGVLISLPLLAGNGVEPEIGNPAVFLPILGSSVYLTLLALLAYGIGLLVRSSAGGIAITLGILLVLPVVLSLMAGLMNLEWPVNIMKFLPDQAGSQLFAYSYDGQEASQDDIVLNGWGGFGVLAAEVLVVGALALTVARRRDV
ncbi:MULTISPECIES: ABC transporter permease [unclassified Curtobacterium]|uniref:ABC transporter permease n=1 Tax=unclassified Curtobacterium TaxID=257496 RepID=UPI000F47B38F|nr:MULTISPECIES: ABC transporter permease [unclassified Curtobacterium]ROQ18723.1 ABC-2 type transport system permease protein [Curtobacterium sp. PhB171]ROQ18989.1 ABC-2 type transport system permease protein [Curtobacterium sp. PhB170]ROS32467.1 ABC-2 type transport system permease protein [Curtobacterium sp. PhB131]ROS74217.1 ABC-2 type transport system permease protein [Curtobacterium sp. PhB141]